ncbi:MAG TPA: efflux RND transporter periplasmic adaptor subunit [Gemmatimonadaceae bacterium]|nr:efflux RND transporter periplasmic adaptor subunit [Gemmatimonadaceae bacterium]
MRFTLPLRSGALLGAVLLAACSDPKTPPPAAVPVSVARVERRDVPYEIQATGTVEPMQTVSVSSQVSGILTRVAFKEGDEVRKGQILFEIDPRPFEAALRQAQGGLAKDSAQLANAQADVKRYETLVQKDYVTTQQYDQVKTTAAALAATVESDRATVETARLNLQYATIRAPISGRAGALLVREGNLVRSETQPLVVINQIRPILVRFAVPASNLPRIRQYAGNTLPVHAQPVSAPGAPSSGTLSFMDNAVDTTTGTILLKGQFANRDGALWPGEFVNTALQLFVQRGAVVAPAQSVVQSQQGTYVFVVTQEGTANHRDVTVGRTMGDIAVIDKGLQPGEIVVTDGQLRITPGGKVQIKTPPGTDQPRT